MGAKFNKPGSNSSFYNISDILIEGYIRLNHALPLAPDIYRLCKEYYIIPKYMFMYDHSAFHILNVTSPTNPQLYKSIIKTNDRSTTWNKPYDLSCYVPNILHSNYLLNNVENNNEKYDGLFCRAHSTIHESGESSRSFYIFDNKYITNSLVRNNESKTAPHTLYQSPTGNRGKLLEYMLYTDDKYGIIGTGGALVPVIYQLKLQNIKDKHFYFNEISDEKNAEKIWGTHPGYQCKQYLTLDYLKDRQQLFAVQCKQEHGASVGRKKKPEKKIIGASCGLYDLPTNQWIKLNNFRKSTYLNDDEDNFKCGLSYNSKYLEMYLVSSLGRTAKYDFHKNCWKVLYENVENFNDMSMRYDMGPIVWFHQYQPKILYCIGGKKNKSRKGSVKFTRTNSNKFKNNNSPNSRSNLNNKYTLQYKSFDLRSDKRQWIDCVNKQKIKKFQSFKQFKDLNFQSMFV